MPLPPGLSINKSTGLITGVPTVPGTYNYDIVVRDAQGAVRVIPVVHVINPYDPPAITGTPILYATRTIPYSVDFNVSGGSSPFVWALATGTLPAGITLDPVTGILSGTPSDVTYTDRPITIRVTDALNSVAQINFTLRYRDVFTTAYAYPTAIQGEAYSATPVTSGGHTPVAWSINSGTLPPGLSFDSTTGRIFGTPSTVTAGPIVIIGTDAGGNFVNISQTFTVVAAYAPVAFAGGMSGTTKNYQRAAGTEVINPVSTLVASGGFGTITYSWVRLSGSTKLAAAAPTSLTTGFNSTAAAGENVSAVFRVTATDGTTSATFDVTITGNNTYVFPSLTGSPPVRATFNKPYTGSFTLVGGKPAVSYAVVGGVLPTGLTINSSTGVISGTPTDITYTDRALTIRVTDAEGQTANGLYTLQYKAAVALSGSPGPAYTTQPYSFTPTRTGGHAPFNFTLDAGALPTGTSLNASTGAVTGTTTTAQVANYTLRVTDADGNTTTQAYTTTVNAYTVPTIINSIAGPATRTVNFLDSVGVTNGLAPFNYSIVSGTLPAGMSLNAANGVVSGAPYDTSYTNRGMVLRVTDALGNSSDTATQTITYRDLPVMTGRTFTRRMRTNAINESVASGAAGHTPFSYSIVAGSLPTGASLNASTGLISGTLTGTSYGIYNVTIRATDSLGATQDADYSLTYADALSYNSGYTNEAEVTRAYFGSGFVGGGFSPYTFTVVAGAQPAGTSLNSSTGQLQGTPTTQGTPSATFRVTDADGNIVDLPLSWTVYANVTAGATVGSAYTNIAVSGMSINGAGGKAPLSYAIVSGALPTGLSLNTSTGAITGTPSAVGNYSFTARVTDAIGYTADVSTNIPVSAPVALTSNFVNATRFNVGVCSATFTLDNTGSASKTRTPSGPGDGPIGGQWMLAGAAANYEAVVTITGTYGDAFTGSGAGTFNLGTTRSWTVAKGAGTGSSGGQLNITIRLAGGGAVLVGPVAITMDATREV